MARRNKSGRTLSFKKLGEGRGTRGRWCKVVKGKRLYFGYPAPFFHEQAPVRSNKGNRK